jgi:hypothetical protein
LCAAGLIPEDRSTIPQYAGLRSVLVPRLISTPRDVKRLTGAFGILVRMLASEVYWVDLLGFCALLTKAPLTVEQIKRDPDVVVDDPTSVDEIVERASDRSDRAPDRQTRVGTVLERLNPEHEGGLAIRRLLGFLFPRLCEDGTGYRPQPRTSISLCKMRSLLTTLRLDLVPGFYSRDEVLKTFSLSCSDVAAFLHQTFEQGRIANFLVKLEDTKDDLAGLNQQLFWQGACQFLKKPDSEFMSTYSPMHELVRQFAVTFVKISGNTGRQLFSDLLTRGEVELTSCLMRSHLYHYGLFGLAQSDRDVFLDRSETEKIARDLSQQHRTLHLAGPFLWGLWELYPVFNMADTGTWDCACRAQLQTYLSDPKAVDALTLMFFAGGFTPREMISKIIDLDEYLRLVEERLSAADMDQSVRAALEKAKDPPFG